MKWRILAAFLFVVPVRLVAGAEDRPVDSTEKVKVNETLKLAKQEAATYDFLLGNEQTTKLTFYPQSVLRWSNPVSGTLYGEVFIWTSQGRPEVVASVYKWYSPHTHMGVEFHSLTTEKLTAMRDKQRVWYPDDPGVQLRPIREAPAPGQTATIRLRQMRLLARQFTAEATDRTDPKLKEQLRLLSKPLYRYESTNQQLLDGAMFAFVQGTNPEVMLLIEARQTAGSHQWHYALARQNSVRFEVQHQGDTVWSVPKIAPPWPNLLDRTKTYTVIRREPDKVGSP